MRAPRDKIRPHIVAAMVQEFKEYKRQGIRTMDACQMIGEKYGKEANTVWHVIDRFRPTNIVATDYIKAQSLRLAMRVVRKANVQESLDILSRPNIGVLAPKTGGEGGSQGGFFLNVTAESLGAVKVGIMAPQAALPGSPDDVIMADAVVENAPQRSFGRQSHAVQEALAKQRAAIQEARKQVPQYDALVPWMDPAGEV